MTEQDRVDGGEQKDWQLWSGALGVQQDFFFFLQRWARGQERDKRQRAHTQVEARWPA